MRKHVDMFGGRRYIRRMFKDILGGVAFALLLTVIGLWIKQTHQHYTYRRTHTARHGIGRNWEPGEDYQWINFATHRASISHRIVGAV